MRGSIVKRPGGYSVVLSMYVTDPATGTRRRKQKWITVAGNKRDAERRLAELVSEHNAGTFVAPHKRSVGDWLEEWVEKAIKPPHRTVRAYETYLGVIAKHLKPALGGVKLQELRALDLERFYAEKLSAGLSPATVEKFHVIIHSALDAAIRSRLITVNEAKRVNNKPHATTTADDVARHCWSPEEAAAFLAAARDAGAQPAAFYALALTTGMRRAELCGLKWADIDLPGGRVAVQRQLLHGGPDPVFTGLKGKRARTVDIAADIVELLRAQRAAQAQIKMRHRRRYHDHDLVFAKDVDGIGRARNVLGLPLQANNIGERDFAPLVAKAGVRRIKFHGLRHTCATLLLAANVPSKVVQERLGHKNISTTLDVYAHVLPSMQRDASDRLSALLGGAARRLR